jgi:hypothetical protein
MGISRKRNLKIKELSCNSVENPNRPPRPSAPEMFPMLRERLLASRPITRVHVPATTRPLRPSEIRESRQHVRRNVRAEFVKVPAQDIVRYGKPTFRNILNEAGKHV